ncbi:serine hydrolase [Rossellomorea vietnamensis]|uniref:serine hydrolase n=1 Tax=Rossellomorea vietnamensis TaxID=218284 RepID=UPI003CEFC164
MPERYTSADYGLLPTGNEPAKDSKKDELTIYHLLTMTAGFHFPEWEEWNGFASMMQGGDTVHFVLKRELTRPPGKSMSYYSGCSHLLTCTLQEAAGETAFQFARRELFNP